MTTSARITGLHHVTSIAGPAAENLEFYTSTLGMRLVKKSVNQDDPGTYHLFYADAEGTPGTDVTFFPWDAMAPGRKGTGLTVELALAVPGGSLDFWRSRLTELAVKVGELEDRFGERALPITDPHGLELALVESADAREFAPWERSPVSAHLQIQGLHAVRLWEADRVATETFLTDVLGFAYAGDESGWRRYSLGGGGSGRLLELRERPGVRRGTWGRGSVHHVAWRVPDETVQHEVQVRVAEAGLRPTPVIDRFWFRSVYFREPGGALFEVATDGPGFAVDEDPSALGEQLVLPPWLEPKRDRIEAVLPALEPARA
ncbi:MAG TPA: ring-cleaving dioxygenase [Gemmatimonadota bacterium]|nr:ring-cleaving dioxygenase [Gemmatimonadota bacterium]